MSSFHKPLLVAAALGSLAVPAVASADGTPTSTDRQNAAQECRFERGTTAATRDAFNAKYGTNANKANAFGKCVSKGAKDEQQQRQEAQANAAKTCKAEQGTTAESQAAFAQKYGTNKSKNNAFGKCVSMQAKTQKQQADAQDRQQATDRKNAAKQCATERGTTDASRQAFNLKYGTNKTKSNAFGKCVSKLAKAQQDDQQQSTQQQS